MSRLPVIATLWIGTRLSWLEQLCLKSFVDAGHVVFLYCYDLIGNAPAGVTLRDARDIFPGDTIIRHARTGSPAIHADIWRLHLMQRTDYVWMDADMLCIRPVDFDMPFVFGLEKPHQVCNAALRLPASSATLARLLDFIADPYAIGPWLKPDQQAQLRAAADRGEPVHFSHQDWGLTGPAALSHYLRETGEWDYAQPQSVFYPVSFRDRNKVILSRFDIGADFLTDQTRTLHLWARRLKPRLHEAEQNRPRRGSFLDQALRRHGITPEDAPIPARVVNAAHPPDHPR
ncbi:hypothetical protein [Paracoccus sp. (in: a-proteobacteria)]|uniref:hypothetical protein n=1 Tax=Paracoccus sp. TaxID=267 RepID=UPI0026DF3DBF|nr:hypothetical protein [Paracoccus sp. (in: a-proteobacteria)]MDO5647484.1 hypothetical protein [Paracoccus sp. (in: a-proteobacteria)]